ADFALVRLDELLTLDEHTARSAAGIVDAPLEGLDHLDQQPNDSPRGVELTSVSPLRRGEFVEEVLVHPAEEFLILTVLIAHFEGEQIDQLAQSRLVQLRSGIILRQDSLEGLVLPLDGNHGVVDDLSNLRLFGMLPDFRPT